MVPLRASDSLCAAHAIVASLLSLMQVAAIMSAPPPAAVQSPADHFSGLIDQIDSNAIQAVSGSMRCQSSTWFCCVMRSRSVMITEDGSCDVDR